MRKKPTPSCSFLHFTQLTQKKSPSPRNTDPCPITFSFYTPYFLSEHFIVIHFCPGEFCPHIFFETRGVPYISVLIRGILLTKEWSTRNILLTKNHYQYTIAHCTFLSKNAGFQPRNLLTYLMVIKPNCDRYLKISKQLV